MTVALVLAAGNGSRMGTPKAKIEIDDERLVDRAVSMLKEAGCTDVYVVLGAWIGDVAGAKVIINENWREGIGSSLRTGLAHISSMPNVESVMISLVDLPGLTAAAAVQILLAPGEIVVGTFEGKPGHPVKFSRMHWQGIIDSAVGDVGAQRYLSSRSDVVYLELDKWASGKDVDTRADLALFLRNEGCRS
ncbi:MAG: nucleotidyltransferase family protein [Candidatus Nanopelagicaceae bacterium]|nr:nucleotidyltransferase family protein [Candidatus Nanopelagicaceae bacterium]